MGVGFYIAQYDYNCLANGHNIHNCILSDLWNESHQTNYFGTISSALWPTLLMLSGNFNS